MGSSLRIPWGCAAPVFLMLKAQALLAAPGCEIPAARMVSVEGIIESRPPAGTAWQRVELNTPVCAGDLVRTGPNSRGGLLVAGSDTMIRLDQNTTFQVVTPPQEKRRSLIDIITGALHFISRVRHSLEVRTPFMNAAVEGTEFMVRVGPEQASVVLFEGVVLASNDAGSLRLTAKQAAVAEKGRPPRLTTLVRPLDAVQWTLHFQHLLSAFPDDARDPLGKALQQARRALGRGDIEGAFDRLNRISPAERDERYHSLRAGLLLAVGRVNEARQALQRALRLDEGNSAALALQAIIAVAGADRQRALELASGAVARNPRSALARIALSYARQADFDLQGAKACVRNALALAPDNPFIQARLAELYLMVGDLDAAVTTARAAVALDPDIALTRRVLGFAHLTKAETGQARAAFQRAIELDQADPLSRLGLGLALIREGRLAAGRRELEIATVLDPGNALVRSYMGKAYYEERRDRLAATQYDMAKERDPRDPTPWYYQALLLHQQGRTVEALLNLQASAARNDNRAVYRSRLLLDQDQAARSAGLGQIYRDLNFEQLALIEGWKTLETNPEDHSGHRLLADTYAYLPKHETARVSELLQAQLLQPVNITPIQPTMAETSLYVPDGLGPSNLAFNEYATLFNRDGVRLQVSASGGSDDMLGEEVLVSGVQGDVSFSLGQYHFNTDGFRDNNDLEQDIWLAFVQANLSDKTSVQFEARRSSSEYGDPRIHFYPEDDARLGWRNDEDRELARLGLHHRFNPRSELIASVIHTQVNDDVDDAFNTGTSYVSVDGNTDGETWNAEVRQLQRWDAVRVTAGLGYLDRKQHANTDITIVTPLPFPLPPLTIRTRTKADRDIRHAKAYLYSSIDLGEALTLNAGLSYDDYDEVYSNKQQFNPKLGLSWRATPRTTVRAAAFRTISRPTSISQTIEPTEVAGFNQFFSGDGQGGERAWRYGVAMDHRFAETLSGGVELSRRERIVPSLNLNTLVVTESHVDDELGRAYLYWSPTDRTAVALEYFYERTFRSANTVETTTHRFPMAVSYFHPSGLGGSLRPTFVRQYGMFDTAVGNDRERFWNLDLSIDYRLPRHRGQVSLEVRNLLDEEFGYFDNGDPNNFLFMADQTIYLKGSLNFR